MLMCILCTILYLLFSSWLEVLYQNHFGTHSQLGIHNQLANVQTTSSCSMIWIKTKIIYKGFFLHKNVLWLELSVWKINENQLLVVKKGQNSQPTFLYFLIFNDFDYFPAIIEAHMGSLLYTMWQIKSHLTMSNSGFKKLIGMPAKQ